MQGVGKKKVAINVLILLAVVLMGMSCALKHPAQWGKVLEYKGGRLFYTSQVTEEEAGKLGGYLLKVGFFRADKPAIVQLTKEGQVYQVRAVVKKGAIEKKWSADEMTPVEAAGLLAEDISMELFNGAKVEWHLCDDKLKTMRIGSY